MDILLNTRHNDIPLRVIIPTGSNTLEAVIQQEVTSLTNEIGIHIGSAQKAILVLTSRDVEEAVREQCRGMGETSQIMVESSDRSVQACISALATSTATRLVIIFGSRNRFCGAIRVPEHFVSLDLVSQDSVRRIMNPESTYCGVRLASWSNRNTHPQHRLLQYPGIIYNLPDLVNYSAGRTPPPFPIRQESDIESAVSEVTTRMGDELSLGVTRNPQSSTALPWLDTGHFSSKFNFDTLGVYIEFQAYETTSAKDDKDDRIAVGGFHIFIPWSVLASWVTKAWTLFLDFMKSIWNHFGQLCDLLVRFFSMIIACLRAMTRAIFTFARKVTSAVLATGAAAVGITVGGTVGVVALPVAPIVGAVTYYYA